MKRNVRTGAGLVAAFFLCAAGSAMAQAKGGGAPDPERMADRQLTAMKERLKLTADQEKKVKPILVESMKKQMEMREKFGAPQQGQRPSQEAMAEMRKAREDTNKKLGEVLSKEQMQDYQKMMAERRGPGGPGRPGARRPQK